MAEFLIQPVADILISQVASLVAAEINLAIDVKRQISKLGKTVTMIQALLNDAERRQVRDQAVKLWLKELEDIAYEAEDVLDDVAYEVLRRKVKIQNKLNKKVSNFLSSSNPILFRLKIAHRIKDINLSLDDIKIQAIGFGLKELYAAAAAPLVKQRLETHAFVDYSKVVGREDEIFEVVNMLTAVSSNQEALSVIPIVGMAGMGKTTFAKCVCNTEQVKMSFGLIMWVTVSEDFDVERILKEMLQHLGESKGDMSNLNAIIDTLRKKVGGRKYLLVLDDVWEERYRNWNRLKDSLEAISPNTSNHIIVTTRLDQVAAITKTMPGFHLQSLSEELCWSIFEQRAFASGGAVRTEKLVSIGKQIVKKCGGLPLAAAASGGMMRTKQNIQEWLSIRDSSVWNVWDESDILPALKLSFDHLPCAALKQCFAYCSIFPKDFDIKKDSLIQLWVGQGLLQPPPGSTLEMEDIGDEYFHMLLWNNLLQDVRMDDYGNIRACKMHDVVHDLATSLSTSGHFAIEASMRDNSIPVCRHLSLISSSETLSNEIKLDCQKLRTLFLEGYANVGSLVKFKRLRGLVFRFCKAQEFPTSIGILKHLRCLNLSESNIKTLPYSVTDLFNLQTLILSCQSFERGVAKDFKKLASLRHFYIEDWEETRSQMPAEIGQLSQLQTVPFFVVGQDKGHGIEELGCLCNLRGTLNLYDLQHVRGREEAKKANLMGKGKIIELQFGWSSDGDGETKNDQDVLEGLQPHHNLKKLTIEGYTGESFPSWMMMGEGMSTFQYLVEIQFVDCDGVEEIPTLGRLPSLKRIKMLEMKGIKRIGHEFYGSSGSNEKATNSTSSSNDSQIQITLFPALKKLSLGSMGSLEEWLEVELPSGGLVFPVLEKLRISYCPQLRNIPSQFPSLKSLTVSDVGNLSRLALSNVASKLSTLTSLDVSELGPSFPLEELMEKTGQSLRELGIKDCQELTRLPDALASLTSLEELDIRWCRNLTCIPCIRSLTSLRELRIGGFGEELESFPCLNNADDLQQLTSLQNLSLFGWPKLKTLPDAIQHLPALKYLGIFCFDGLVELPDWLGNLSSLQQLVLLVCYSLKLLPDAAAMQRLSNLKCLRIEDCPRLKEAISNRSGPEWSKIAHIPEVFIDRKRI